MLFGRPSNARDVTWTLLENLSARLSKMLMTEAGVAWLETLAAPRASGTGPGCCPNLRLGTAKFTSLVHAAQTRAASLLHRANASMHVTLFLPTREHAAHTACFHDCLSPWQYRRLRGCSLVALARSEAMPARLCCTAT